MKIMSFIAFPNAGEGGLPEGQDERGQGLQSCKSFKLTALRYVVYVVCFSITHYPEKTAEQG
jgi:hypothetical protein